MTVGGLRPFSLLPTPPFSFFALGHTGPAEWMDPANSVLNRLERRKNRAFPVFVFRKYFCRSITKGTGYRGGRKESGRRQVVRASLPWNEMPPPCLMQCRGKKKEAEGLVPFLHLVRFGSLQGIARLWLDGAQSVSQCSRCRPLSLSPHSLLPPLLHLLYTPSAAETAIAFPRPFSLTASTAARLVCSFPQLSATDIQHLSQHKLRFAQLIELSILLAQCFVQQQWIRYVLQSQKKKNISFSD